ncbi:MAG TPA: hypothetical protein VEF33_15320 [Syntrophales bacterium]|nr:hypothetical protein [Syntrophales bacterium]
MDKYDNLEIRCPRLGGEVKFSYCRKEGGGLPCLRVITCWYPYFPVEQHLRESMTTASWNNFVLKVPKDKVTTLIELIEEAKRLTNKENL